jgi:hypothetical protein
MSHQDGHCATDAETTYVKKGGTCAMAGAAGGGSAATPFCFSQDGIASALATNKRIVVMRGPDPLTEFTAAVTGGALTVIGQNAAIYPGARDGIRVSSGDVTIRGLTVATSAGIGVVAEGTAMLRLNRCIIKGNAKGGLVAMGSAGFDVSNTVFDGNGPGAVGLAGFGGAYLGPNMLGRFRHNTVVGNMDRGVVCERPSQALSGVLLFDNLIADQFNCTVTASSSKVGVEPMFSTDPTRPYHLTSSSPCTNAGGTSDFPPDDIDGDPRPQPIGGSSDCGADELRQ